MSLAPATAWEGPHHAHAVPSGTVGGTSLTNNLQNTAQPEQIQGSNSLMTVEFVPGAEHKSQALPLRLC